MATKLLVVAVGGAAGSVLRYLVSGGVHRASGSLFPLGTLTVNVIGCLLIGFLGAVFAGATLVREEVRIGVLVGILGGFTTFSSFAWETLKLAGDGQFGRAALNIALSNSLGLAAAWIGYRGAQRWFGA